MPDPEPVRQRRVDIEYLLGNRLASLLVVLHSADGAGALRQLDQGDANVVDQGDQHLADIVLLGVGLPQHRPVPVAAKLTDRRHPQHTLDNVGDLPAELRGNHVESESLLAHRPVEYGSYQAVVAHVQFCQYLRHVQARGQAVTLPGPVAGIHTGRNLCGLHQLAGGEETLRLRRPDR